MGTIGRANGAVPFDTYDKTEAVSKSGEEVITGQKTFTTPVKLEDATTTNEACTLNQVRGFKNLIINGGFDVSQRGTSFVNGGYTLDRWLVNQVNGSVVVSTTDVRTADYWLGAKNVISLAPQNGVTAWSLLQRLEDVSTVSGKTITVSFIAAVGTGTYPLDFMQMNRAYGTGGSTSDIDVFDSGIVLTTTPTRYTITRTIPSVNGKTIGAGSYFELAFQSTLVGIGQIVYFSNIQLEEGSVATPFEQRPYGLELSLCQRYYEASDTRVEGSLNYDKTALSFTLQFKQSKRVLPSITVDRAVPSPWTPTGEDISKDAYWCFYGDVTNYWTIMGYTADAEIY